MPDTAHRPKSTSDEHGTGNAPLCSVAMDRATARSSRPAERAEGKKQFRVPTEGIDASIHFTPLSLTPHARLTNRRLSGNLAPHPNLHECRKCLFINTLREFKHQKSQYRAPYITDN
jgi:hypothetical protein